MIRSRRQGKERSDETVRRKSIEGRITKKGRFLLYVRKTSDINHSPTVHNVLYFVPVRTSYRLLIHCSRTNISSYQIENKLVLWSVCSTAIENSTVIEPYYNILIIYPFCQDTSYLFITGPDVVKVCFDKF